jgi:hypothetical protein
LCEIAEIEERTSGDGIDVNEGPSGLRITPLDFEKTSVR